MTFSRNRFCASITILATTTAVLAQEQAELTGIELAIDTFASANTGNQSDNCSESHFADSLDQLPFNEECFAGISGNDGSEAVAEVFAKFNAYHNEDTLVVHTWLEAYAASYGNAGSAAEVDVDGYLEFELPYQSEVEFENCSVPELYDNVVTFSLFNIASGEEIELDDGGFHDCGTTVLVLDAGYYAILIDGFVYDVPGDETGGGISTSISVDVTYLDSPRERADLNGDGKVDGADLAQLLASFGSADPDADLDLDGVVDGRDLTILLGNWGWLGYGDPDINRDGVVNEFDLFMATDLLGTDSEIADLNHNGIVDYDDLQIIIDAMD